MQNSKTLKLSYDEIKILYSVSLMVEQAEHPEYKRTYNYSNQFIHELEQFIFHAKSYKDEMLIDVKCAAEYMNKLPYKKPEEKDLWIKLMFINKINYIGD